MKWVNVNDKLPEAGKYIVKTKRTHWPLEEGSEQVIESVLTVTTDKNSKVTKSWNCRNQVVTQWLDENEKRDEENND